jgi:hypothetical protein
MVLRKNLLLTAQPTAMDESSALMKKAHAAHEHGIVLEDDSGWGGTPELRKLWSNKLFKPKLTANESSEVNYGSNEVEMEGGRFSRQPSIDELDEAQADAEPFSNSDSLTEKMRSVASHCMVGTPGLIIALVLNLFLSMSFGQAFFPTSWQFPVGIPRAIGVQMFLFSTLISQLVMTAMSEFPTAMGMMMVENIPFMHIIAQIAVKQQGPGIETFSTVFVTFALSTIVVGIAFYILGAFKIGNAVYFFPRHVIIGCIGGIGIFIIQTGVEVSCDRSWEWSLSSFAAFAQTSVAVHWLASLAFVALLRILLAVFNAPLLPPFYFVAIPPAFYLILLVCGVSQQQAREQNWFFPAAENVDPLLIWELIDIRLVNWKAVSDCIPTIIALSLFRYERTFMHAYSCTSAMPSLTFSSSFLAFRQSHARADQHPLALDLHPARRGHEPRADRARLLQPARRRTRRAPELSLLQQQSAVLQVQGRRQDLRLPDERDHGGVLRPGTLGGVLHAQGNARVSVDPHRNRPGDGGAGRQLGRLRRDRV